MLAGLTLLTIFYTCSPWNLSFNTAFDSVKISEMTVLNYISIFDIHSTRTLNHANVYGGGE